MSLELVLASGAAFNLPSRLHTPMIACLLAIPRPDFSFLFACLFFSLPPRYVSSASTVPSIGGHLTPIEAATSRRRPSMNHAVFCVTPISRASWQLLIPLRLEVTSQNAINHFWSGKRLSSKIVPLRTENVLSQALHL